jgi:hypothetical protein
MGEEIFAAGAEQPPARPLTPLIRGKTQMKYLAFTTIVLACTASAASAQSSFGGGGYFGGGMTGAVYPNVRGHPGYACPINLKCGQNLRPLDPNAPTYAPKRKAKR